MVKWLHISDLHYNYSNYSTKKMRDNLLNKISKEVDLNGVFDFVVITGDLAYQSGGYGKELQQFICNLITCSKIEKTELFIVPGNHDLKRSEMRTRLIESIVNGDNRINAVEDVDKDTLNHLHKGQKSFWTFYNKITGKEYTKDKLHFIDKRDKFNIINMNTSLLCGRDNEEGKLSIFLGNMYDTLHNQLEKNKINIAIGHHNIDCFFVEEREKITNNFVDEGVDIYLCGHSHKPKFSVDNNNDREFYVVMAGAGVVDTYSKPTYSIGKVNNDSCSITYFGWDNEDEIWNLETKGLGRKANDGVINFNLNNKTSNEKDIYIEEDEFKNFIINFHENVDSNNIDGAELIKADIEQKFENMKCNSSIRKQFNSFSKYFPIIDGIMYDNTCLGMDKRIVIPNVICEEYNNTLNVYDNGNEILEQIVNRIYARYKTKISYSEVKLKVYIKTLVFWLINECDIFDDRKG